MGVVKGSTATHGHRRPEPGNWRLSALARSFGDTLLQVDFDDNFQTTMAHVLVDEDVKCHRVREGVGHTKAPLGVERGTTAVHQLP